MQFRIKHLLLLTTATALLLAVTSLHPGVAWVLTALSLTVHIAVTILLPVVFAAGVLIHRSLEGGLSRAFVSLFYVSVVAGIAATISGFMLGWGLGH